MNETSALFTVVAISVLLSSITVFAIYQPCAGCSKPSARSGSRRNSGRARQ